MPDLNISVASPHDHVVIAEIIEQARAWLTNTKGIDQWSIPFTADWISKCIARQEFFVANADDLTVGVFRLLKTDPAFWGETAEDAVYLHSLAVRRTSTWQGRGIGHSLLTWAEEYTAQQQPYLRLDCMAENAALCRYYEQAGFIACGTKEIQFGSRLWKSRLFQKAVGPYADMKASEQLRPPAENRLIADDSPQAGNFFHH